MLYHLRRHPLPIVAHFDHCLVLTYTMSASLLQSLLPPGLVVDSNDGGCTGFLAIAMVQTSNLRPAGFPERAGQDFFLTGYRIFTTFQTPAGRRMRGLRILRSDTDRPLMAFWGNLLTRYNYRTARVRLHADDSQLAIRVATRRHEADLCVQAKLNSPGQPLPGGSCFTDQRAARRYAGPLPYTFDYEPETDSIIAIRGIRQHWLPRLVDVEVAQNTFLERPPFDSARPRLAAAFHVHNVPYRWEKGTVYRLRQPVLSESLQ